MSALPRTHLAYQYDSTQLALDTTVISITAFPDLPEANRALFKQATGQDHVVVVASTIFHPQGGGQPSDTGTITSPTNTFHVSAARQDAVQDGQVLHLGSFTLPNEIFKPGDVVTQYVDADKRVFYSQLHTAGHVLGSAVNKLLSQTVPDFKELKASHFPDSAACEFRGLIDGRHNADIQAKVDEFVAAKMPVEIVWWDAADFEKEGVEMPEHTVELPAGEKWRVVKILGAEAYPCGVRILDGYLIFQEDMSPQDWDLFKSLASRVKAEWLYISLDRCLAFELLQMPGRLDSNTILPHINHLEIESDLDFSHSLIALGSWLPTFDPSSISSSNELNLNPLTKPNANLTRLIIRSGPKHTSTEALEALVRILAFFSGSSHHTPFVLRSGFRCSHHGTGKASFPTGTMHMHNNMRIAPTGVTSDCVVVFSSRIPQASHSRVELSQLRECPTPLGPT
ncbi:hypothetical protein FRB98_009596 [Tulasnella sp. 332]|nr:hypothetical protein FRB98_009596 [Tulasnella sp. 332]